MLQYPTNVYPEDIAVDGGGNNRYISFTFNGDILSTAAYRIYDYATGDVATMGHLINDSRLPLCYNGDTVNFNYSTINGLINGRDYVMQLMLTQSSTDGNSNICDMFALRGTVVQQLQGNVIAIETDIPSIYDWDIITHEEFRSPTSYSYNTGSSSVNIAKCAVMMMKIGDESKLITRYYPNKDGVGQVYLESGFSFTVTAGMRYEIWCNYIISPQYFFKCRTAPTVTSNISKTPKGIRYSATYSQSQNDLIKYYKLTLYGCESNVGADYPEVKLAETNEIYSQQINHLFFGDYNTGNYGTIIKPNYCRVACDIVTNDNQFVEAGQGWVQFDAYSNASGVDLNPATVTVSKYDSYIQIDINNDAVNWTKYGVKVVRIDMNDVYSEQSYINYRLPDKYDGENYGRYKEEFIGLVPVSTAFRDYTISNQGKYRYKLIPYSKNESDETQVVCAPYITDEISTSIYNYTIIALHNTGKKLSGKPFYLIKDYNRDKEDNMGIWNFNADISGTIVTQNFDKVLHIGYGQYSDTTSTNVDYLSGSVTGMLGYLDCGTKEYVDTIELVKKWRAFISQPCLFLLKSQKGDVWVVNITDNSTTEYDETIRSLPTTFTFSWAECCSVDDIFVNISTPIETELR